MKPRLNSAKVSSYKTPTKTKINITSKMYNKYVQNTSKPKENRQFVSYEESSKIKQNKQELLFEEHINKFFKIIAKEKCDFIDPSYQTISDDLFENLKFTVKDKLRNPLTEKDYNNRLYKICNKEVKNILSTQSKQSIDNQSEENLDNKNDRSSNIELERKEKALVIQMYYRRYLLNKKSKELKTQVAKKKEKNNNILDKNIKNNDNDEISIISQNGEKGNINILKDTKEENKFKEKLIKSGEKEEYKEFERYSFENNEKSFNSNHSDTKEIIEDNDKSAKGMQEKFSIEYDQKSLSIKSENQQMTKTKNDVKHEEKYSFDSSNMESYQESFDKVNEIEKKALDNSYENISINEEF